MTSRRSSAPVRLKAWLVECAVPSLLADTPCIRPWRLLGGIHAASGSATGKHTAPDSGSVAA